MRLKNILAGVLALTLVFSLTACGGDSNSSSSEPTESSSSTESSLPDEEPSQAPVEGDPYTAKVQGYGGEFEVTVILDGDKIAAVQVGENTETTGIGSEAIDQLPGKIVEAQSVAVDGVAGATITSDAIKDGVLDALKQAGKDVETYQNASMDSSMTLSEASAPVEGEPVEGDPAATLTPIEEPVEE